MKKHQPFYDNNFDWLQIVDNLAVNSKHIDLVPQTRIERKQVKVSGPGGSVGWDASSVRFGSGVSIMGAPVDPRTQRVIPNPNISENVETWVSFVIGEYNVNALGFCQKACRGTRRIVEDMTIEFGL